MAQLQRFMGNFLLLGITISLIACAATKETTSSTPSPDATAQLAEAAATVSHSLSELAMVERATIAAPSNHLPNPAYYPGMSNLISIDWSGPVGPVVKRIADLSDYHLRVLGRPPAVPAVVTISAKNAPIADVLRDIAFQSSGKAKIYVVPQQRTIELRYLS